MSSCEICNTKIDDEEICSICYFPLKGTKQEQVKYRAKQIMQKSDVKYSFKRVLYARGILFVIGGFYGVLTFLSYGRSSMFIEFYVNTILAVLFIGFAILSFKAPKLAITIPFALIVMFNVLMIIVDVSYIFQGLFWKSFIILGLGYATFSVWKADKILRDNPYLASEMGLKKTQKIAEDVLDDL